MNISSQASTIQSKKRHYELLAQYWYLIVAAGVLLRFLCRRYFSVLRAYPGPLLASGSRLWKVWSVAAGHAERDRIRVHLKYGSVVRIAPNELSFASPQAARELLAAGKGFHKTDFYGVFPPPENPDIFTETREHVHAQKKRVAAQAYSMATMKQFGPRMDNTIRFLLSRFDEFCNHARGCDLDLGEWLHLFAFDVLGEVAFSKSFGFLEAGKDIEGAIKTIDNSQWYNGIVGQVPWMDNVLRRNPLRQLFSWTATNQALITRMAIKETDLRKPYRKIDSHDSRDRKDLLDSLIKGHLAHPDTFGEGDVFAIAHGAIFAGSDSTASTMQSFFYYVLSTPGVYSKLMGEIDDAENTGELSPNIQLSEALRLEYFQAALKEAMRIRPAVGLDITRLIPAAGALIDGNKYPGSITAAVNGWVIHRDEQVFGPHTNKYDPERWLQEPDKAKMMDKYMFQFGGGSHLCIGKNLAILEMNKLLPTLLRKYHFQLVDPNAQLKHHSTFFVVQTGLIVNMIDRERAKELNLLIR